MKLFKPDYSELDFCIATKVLPAKESQHLRMMENDPVEGMDMEKGHISALQMYSPFAEDRSQDPANSVMSDPDFHRLSLYSDALKKLH